MNIVMQQSMAAFEAYRKIPANGRATFLRAIADGLEMAGDELLEVTAGETNLPLPRLKGERGRTCFQLRMLADLITDGHWVEAIIDHAKPAKAPPAPDIRRMRIALGPVVVFGASNFPYAYSTAGGDTASALAAGCSVVVKQHPAHAATSLAVYNIMLEAAEKTGMPPHTIQHVPDEGFATGKALVQHPATAAVGFTGSYNGGMALLDYARERKHTIPVFAEMGSTNPVLLLPDSLSKDADGLAEQYAGSITLGVGQFCTNPGLIFGLAGSDLDRFVNTLGTKVGEAATAPMLHPGIAEHYTSKRTAALAAKGVTLASSGNAATDNGLPEATVAVVSADRFLEQPTLHEEIFGPWSLVVQCESVDQMEHCLKVVEGQLTTSIMGTDLDFTNYPQLLELAPQIAGRVVFNGVPTGVEVCAAMVHGGPHPATTDSRFTAVGPMSIQRWTRPVCWQNAPDQILPAELQEANPLHIWRMVNGEMKRD